jgi:hypothetical protein
MLNKLYVAGSLKNNDDGFEVSIRNTLAPGTIVAVGSITVDETAFGVECITVQLGKEIRPGPDIKPDLPLRFTVGSTATLRVTAPPLEAGKHQITISTLTKEAGELRIQAADGIEV